MLMLMAARSGCRAGCRHSCHGAPRSLLWVSAPQATQTLQICSKRHYTDALFTNTFTHNGFGRVLGAISDSVEWQCLLLVLEVLLGLVDGDLAHIQ